MKGRGHGGRVVAGGPSNKEDRSEGRMRTVGAQAASPPRSPSNPPAASGGAPCEGNSQELQACHVECGTGMVRSQDRPRMRGPATHPSSTPCLPPSY